MVLIKEMRIVMPSTLADYELGADYTASKSAFEASKEAKGDDAIEVAFVKEYFDEDYQRSGTHTRRIYHVGNYLPGWISAMLPKSAVTFYEDSYVCYPKIETIVTNEWLGERLEFKIQTRVAEGRGEIENILKLSEEQLKIRKVVNIDILEYKSKDLDPKMHPSNVTLTKVKPSPLAKGWQDMAENLICSYKTVTIKVQVWGLQDKLEKWVMGFEEDLLARVHVNQYAWADEWMGLTREDIDNYVKKCQQELKELNEKKRAKADDKDDKKEKKDKK